MSRIETVVFDVSGVLLDDLRTVWRAEVEAYEACGFRRIESLEKFRETFRLPVEKYHESMGVPSNMVPRLEAEFRRAYAKHNGLIRVFPEVKEVLSRLRSEEMSLAIASNIPSDFLGEHLERFGLDGYFDVVTGQDDCEAKKPSPEPILSTLSRLGSKPEGSVYVGDMEQDMIAGKRAGVCTIAICREEGYHPCWRLRRQDPDFVIFDLHGLLTVISSLNAQAESL